MWSCGRAEAPMPPVFRVSSPLGLTVYLDATGWEHIQRRHPEMDDPAPLQATVEDPDVVYPGSTKKARLLHLRLGIDERHPRLYVTVVTGEAGGASRIVTAHLQPDLAGAGGALLYARPTRR